MTPFILALSAGFTGSFHCIGMCGPLVALHGHGNNWKNLVQYQIGRLISYALLGTISGALGSRLGWSLTQLGFVQRGILILFGVLLIGLGLLSLFKKNPHFEFLGHLSQKISKVTFFQSWPSLTAGGLSAFLPCGYLYAFVLASASLASSGWSAMFMAFFWLGTLPGLWASGWIVQALGRRTSGKLALATPLFLMVLGILALAGKWTTPIADTARCAVP